MINKESASVAVTIPPISITLEDLAFLRSLTPGAVRCSSSEKTKNKLIFLGLITRGIVKPCPKAVKAWEREQRINLKAAEKAWNAQDWDALSNLCYTIKRSRPVAKEDLILTPSGTTLLAKGSALSKTVAIRGCL